jgi:hypothetical protein
MFSISPFAGGGCGGTVTAGMSQRGNCPYGKLSTQIQTTPESDFTETDFTETEKAIPNRDGLAYCSEENC